MAPYGKHTVDTWQTHGRHMADIWQAHGRHMADPRQTHVRHTHVSLMGQSLLCMGPIVTCTRCGKVCTTYVNQASLPLNTNFSAISYPIELIFGMND